VTHELHDAGASIGRWQRCARRWYTCQPHAASPRSQKLQSLGQQHESRVIPHLRVVAGTGRWPALSRRQRHVLRLQWLTAIANCMSNPLIEYLTGHRPACITQEQECLLSHLCTKRLRRDDIGICGNTILSRSAGLASAKLLSSCSISARAFAVSPYTASFSFCLRWRQR